MNTPPYTACPWCTSPLPQDDPYRQECSSCGNIVYHNSSPCMGALPLDEHNRVLLGKRSIEPYYGAWNTVGGFLGYGEDPIEGLKREVREETGSDCEVDSFVTMNADRYGENGQALLNSYFIVRLLSEELTPEDDISELCWFPLDALPDNIAFAGDRKALAVLKQQLDKR